MGSGIHELLVERASEARREVRPNILLRGVSTGMLEAAHL